MVRVDYDRDVWRAGLGPCVMCEDMGIDSTRAPRDPHHVVFAQHLRKRGHADLLGCTANRVALCRFHHEAFHAGRRIPRQLIPAEALAFAEDLGLGYLIDRYYGPEEVAA